jgi:galactose mutarotase-like enzyme
MNYTLKNEYLTAVISDIGGETLSISDRSGKEYMWRADPAIWEDRAPLLFPICGEIKDGCFSARGKTYSMPGHGFLPKLPLTAIKEGESKLVLTASESEFTPAQYPFRFRLTVTYSLIGKKLLMEACVENTDACELPFMFGGHPGLSLAVSPEETLESHAIEFPGKECCDIHYLQNVSFAAPKAESFPLPSGKLALSDALFATPATDTLIFEGAPLSVTLACEKSGKRVTVSRSESLPFLCVWRMMGKGADFVCIEPWSGIPSDGVTPEVFETRGHMCRLAPGEKKCFSYGIEIESL